MQHPLRPLFVATALLALIALTAPEHAFAHAVPQTSEPPINGVTNDSPALVAITFSEEIVPDETTIDVLAADGTSVTAGKSEANLNDPNRQQVSVGLVRPLTPGTYLVQWTSQSAIDNDIVSGSFRFTYDPSATPVSSTPEATPSANPTAIAPPDGTSTNDSGDSTDLALALIAILALVVASLLIFALWRRRSHK